MLFHPIDILESHAPGRADLEAAEAAAGRPRHHRLRKGQVGRQLVKALGRLFIGGDPIVSVDLTFRQVDQAVELIIIYAANIGGVDGI